MKPCFQPKAGFFLKVGIMKIRVLIVDDHQKFRDGLKVLIDHEIDMEVVGEAEDGKKAIAITRELHPDIILMDMKMPVMDGAEATRQILSEMPDMKILAISMYYDAGFMEGMLRAGALQYVLKGCDSKSLTDTIRRIVGYQKT
jgi:DNA-binding NarL/FixJ family response regulator